ncbi:MAG: leucine--tRNA ligase [Alistipes sp.]|nr:leucine--tRNA ligase [Alistipes sp.]
MEYNFKEIEPRRRSEWRKHDIYRVSVDPSRPKYYVLDMFPYPSGAGLHVGHPLGYIASDIYTRYKRLCGFNVLHPMGFDAFGLPAEQYAIQTGQHPATTTAQNVARYREQMDKIGFSYDWSRQIETCDPAYYKWTQWAFVKMFESWYDPEAGRARPIAELRALRPELTEEDLMGYRLAYRAETMVNWCEALGTVLANDEVVGGLSERGGHPVEQRRMMQWLLRVSAYAERLLGGLDGLEWSDSLKEIQRGWIGKSVGAQVFFNVAGGEEAACNDNGRGEAAGRENENGRGEIDGGEKLEVFTTRPDTIYGVTFMVIAPEHERALKLTTPAQKAEVERYIAATKKRSERERIADTKKVTGVFTGSYAVNPFSGTEIPIYISDYVLAGYGTGAIMAVPAHDSRDWAFAKHFDLPIVPVVEGGDVAEASYDAKSGQMINSDLINGLEVKDAIEKMFDQIERRGLGRRKVNYRLRDAIFSRQRYWGEPIPIYYKDGVATAVPLEKLPLELPAVSDFSPTRSGEPPLARVENWTYEGYPLETSTMPGFAGSSAYYIRYMDPANDTALVSREADDYWRSVDLYMGGIEHATGHLIYSRFWNKFLFDLGVVAEQEPYKKLVNQGMIQGRSNFVYRFDFSAKLIRPIIVKHGSEYLSKEENPDAVKEAEADYLFHAIKDAPSVFFSLEKYAGFKEGTITKRELYDAVMRIPFFADLTRDYNTDIEVDSITLTPLHVDISLVKNDVLDVDAFRAWRPEFAGAQFVTEENGKYVCGWAIEKMSKSMYNVVNPDMIVENYGADTLRMYEMFLGPLEQSKPWDTNGIDGVHKFLRRFWGLFWSDGGRGANGVPVSGSVQGGGVPVSDAFRVSDAEPTPEELKTLHKTIKKVREDIENFSLNTSVAAFMVCLNELGKCDKRAVLEPLTILLAPFAPHIADELWSLMGHATTIFDEKMPEYNPEYLVENSFDYPVSVNGKLRFKKTLPLGLTVAEIEAATLEDENAAKWLEGKAPKKMIVVPGKIVNIVI